jgi:RecA/RadA recombinase
MSAELKKRLLRNTTLEFTSVLSDSVVFNKKDMIPTSVPAINLALSGRVDGGLTAGLLTLAGPSKHFKSAFALLMARSFLKKYPNGIILFYDSEFGTPKSYFASFDIPEDSVIHSPITDIEQLKNDIVTQLSGLKREDEILIIIDSVGNLASKKEVEDALAGKSVADMTRARALKSLFRMVTPHLTLKNIPLVVVNHTYKTLEMYSKDVVSGGTGVMYSSDNVWIIGRQQDKDDKTKKLDGYHFIVNIEKSRYVEEKSKIPISVSFAGGINRWSGMLELALEGGFVGKPKAGYYAKVDPETGEIPPEGVKEDGVIENDEFWKDIFKTTKFAEWLKKKYTLTHGSILKQDDGDLDIGEDVED